MDMATCDEVARSRAAAEGSSAEDYSANGTSGCPRTAAAIARNVTDPDRADAVVNGRDVLANVGHKLGMHEAAEEIFRCHGMSDGQVKENFRPIGHDI